MRYSVAVVDDEPEILQRITELLKKYEQSCGNDPAFDVVTFSSGDALLQSESSVDIIFLDINMPGTNGLRVAKKIREHNMAAVIVFCTHYAQYAINGYEVNAAGYILKPINELSFNRNLERVLLALKSGQSRQIRIKTLHGVEMVSLSDIVYLEIKIHNLYYYVLRDGKLVEYRTRGSMQEMVTSLEQYGFARCSACYLVNMKHVNSVLSGGVRLSNGITLSISRKFLRGFSESFAKFLERNGTINA